MPPRKRESLESVKERLVTEQKARTERRVRQLLQQDSEVSDDSEEDNRLTARHYENCSVKDIERESKMR